MCVYVYVCEFIRVYMYVYLCICIFMCMCMCMCMYMCMYVCMYLYVYVHQTAKIAPKSPAKLHNRTAPQIILHRTATHRMVQCGLRFYNKKTPQTAPHRIAPFYILMYLIIFKIKDIINSLITLVFQKNKKKIV